VDVVVRAIIVLGTSYEASGSYYSKHDVSDYHWELGLNMKDRKVTIRLGVIAVLLGVIGACLVTQAAFNPYIPKTAGFAAFCWFVVLVILVGTIRATRTKQ